MMFFYEVNESFLRVSDKKKKENNFQREKIIIVYSIFYEIID